LVASVSELRKPQRTDRYGFWPCPRHTSDRGWFRGYRNTAGKSGAADDYGRRDLVRSDGSRDSRLAHVAGAKGEIIRAAWQGPRLRPETVDAQEHGMARGTWRVHHPTGESKATFESDAPWASQLQKGAKVRVLVDPRRPRVLLDLGPAAES
jgi:hypothetical protein